MQGPFQSCGERGGRLQPGSPHQATQTEPSEPRAPRGVRDQRGFRSWWLDSHRSVLIKSAKCSLMMLNSRLPGASLLVPVWEQSIPDSRGPPGGSVLPRLQSHPQRPAEMPVCGVTAALGLMASQCLLSS